MNLFTIYVVSPSVDVVVCLPLRGHLEGFDKHNSNKQQDQQHRGNHSSQGRIGVCNEAPVNYKRCFILASWTHHTVKYRVIFTANSFALNLPS